MPVRLALLVRRENSVEDAVVGAHLEPEEDKVGQDEEHARHAGDGERLGGELLLREIRIAVEGAEEHCRHRESDSSAKKNPPEILVSLLRRIKLGGIESV